MDASWPAWGEVMPTLVTFGAVAGLVLICIRAASQTMKHAVEDADIQTSKKIDAKFERIEEQFKKIDATFDKIDARFEKVDAKFDGVAAKVERTEERVETRIYAMERRLNSRIDRVEELLRSALRSTGTLPAEEDLEDVSNSD